MVQLRDVVDLFHGWYPPDTAEDWDAVGLVYGDPHQAVTSILLAVDPVDAVAREAASTGADLLITHHPLFLRPVHGFAAVTPKGTTLSRLAATGCALLTGHTNADSAVDGVCEALARVAGLGGLRPLIATPGAPDTGSGRIGEIEAMSLADFAGRLAAALPVTAAGVRVAGDPDRSIRRVAVAGGAGDFLLDTVAETDADVFVTSDLRHHPASEFLERGGPALVDIPHWAAEWTWLPRLQARLQSALGDTVVTRVSTIVTDPWQFRL